MTATASLTPTGKQGGFTYVSVVILVTVIGLVGAMSLRLGSTLQRAAAEQELLNIGIEYSNALASYAAATPAGQPNYPNSFKELLRDSRFPQTRRHLRRVYVDPMTGSTEWGLVKATENGGILAIYSLSKAAPIKIGNFPPRFVAFEGKASISEWRFTGEGVQPPGPQAAQAMPGQPPKPGAAMPPGTGLPPGSSAAVDQMPMPAKPGMTPAAPPKPVEPVPESEPEQEAPPEETPTPQEPPSEPEPEPQRRP